jgi:DHA1 family multidrug resistance protein-like MFS transporter
MVMFMLTGLVETAGVSHFLSFNVFLLRGFGLPEVEVKQWVGVLGSLTFLLGLPLAPFWGTWADKYSRKLIIVRSAAIESLMFALIGLSGSLPALIGSAALTGLVLGNTGVMLAALSEAAPKQRVGFALAMIGASPSLGFALGPVLGGQLLSGLRLGPWSLPALNLHQLFFVDAGLSLASTLMLIVFFREPRHAARTDTRVLEQVHSAIVMIVRTPGLRILFAVAMLGQIAQRLASTYLPVFVTRQYTGADQEAVVGLVVGAGAGALALFAPLWGALGDRAGHARVLPLSAAGASLALLALAAAGVVTQIAAAWVVVGALLAGINPLFYTLIALRAPEGRRSTVLNFAYFPLYFGGLIGPATGVLLANARQPVEAVFVAASVSLGLAAVTAVVARHM